MSVEGTPMARVMVVGASLAGVHAAAALRRDGFAGDLVVVDGQPHQPYDRPPLSKELLVGRMAPDDLALRAADGLEVTWRLGASATGLELDPAGGGRVRLEGDGEPEVGFDGLVLACGAAPRTLPGTEGMEGVQVLRTLDDALELRDALDAGIGSLVVVGAGFIGLEVAASARRRGCAVTVVEPLEQPLGRVLGPEVGAALARIHRGQGVDLRLGVGVASVTPVAEAAGASGGATAADGAAGDQLRVSLTDGTTLTVDRVVVGIGVVPATAWLEGSGLTLDNGVVCDPALSAAPGVVAAGDVVRWPSARAGRLVRVEHWDHAVASGEAAARRLLGGPDVPAFDPVPWFWSDQYDTKVQLVGFADPTADFEVVGSLDEDRFAVVYGRAGRVTAVLGVSRPRHVAMLRQAVTDAVPFDEAVATARAL